METVAGETPLSNATSRRVTAVLLSFRRVKNGSEIVADRGARRVNIFITGGARRLAVRGGVAGHVCGEASNEAQVRSGESALQSISNMKIAYRTKTRATAQARFSNLGLPFPKPPNATLAKSAHAGMRPTTFRRPGDGIIPCGLPPFWNQAKKKTNSNRVAQLAMISAATVQYILQPGVVPSVAVVAKALPPTHSSEQGRRKSMIVTIYTECAPRTAAAQFAAARYRRSSRPSTATCAFLTSDSGTRGKPRAGRSGGKPPHSKMGSLRGIGRSEFSSQLAARFSY